MEEFKGDVINRGVLCQICGEGYLQPHVKSVCFEYRGKKEEVDSHYSVCSECLSVTATPEQTKLNKDLILKIKCATERLLAES